MSENSPRAVDKLTVRFVQYESAFSTEGDDVTVSWKDFYTFIMSQGMSFAEDKHKTELLVPVKFQEGTNTKHMKNVELVTLALLDFDELSQEEYEFIVSRIEEEQLEALVYSSWGHAKALPKYKFRVVLPLTEPVTPADWDLLWPQLNHIFGGLADPKCRDCSHGYFMPAAPPGTSKKKLILDHYGGNPVDVNELVDSVLMLEGKDQEDYERPTGGDVIPRDRLKAFAKYLVRSRNEYKSWMGHLLLKVLNGEVFAESGSRDDTLYKIAGDLGQEFPEADAAGLADIFEASLAQMGADCPTVDEVRRKIQRAQQRVLAERRKEKRLKSVQEKKQRELFGGDYTPETINEFCKITGNNSSFELFARRLIVQKKSRYYVFFQGNYDAFTEAELVNACRDRLIPAQKAYSVNLYNVSDKGFEIPKSVVQLVHDYGVVAREEIVSFKARSSYFDEETSVFYEAPCPIRVTAKRHDKVERYIDEICSSERLAEAFRDWLAVAPDTSKALSMLVLLGPSGIGKSSFAEGVSRIWRKDGASSMATALGIGSSHNGSIKRCPLLLADEALPTDGNGKVPSDKLRSLISSSSHEINTKYGGVQNAEGYFRLVAAIQNKAKLRFGKVEDKEDILAIKQRMLFVQSEIDESRYFEYDLFVAGDAIAEHAMWLMENRKVEDARFGISDYSSSGDAISIFEDVRVQQVMDWILWYLDTRKYDEGRQESPAFVGAGRLYINSELVLEALDAPLKGGKSKNELKWTRNDMGRVLNLICDKDKSIKVRDTLNLKQRKYHPMSKGVLKKYLQDLGSDGDIPVYLLQLLKPTQRRGFAPFRVSDQDLEAATHADTLINKLRLDESFSADEEELLPLLLKYYE